MTRKISHIEAILTVPIDLIFKGIMTIPHRRLSWSHYGLISIDLTFKGIMTLMAEPVSRQRTDGSNRPDFQRDYDTTGLLPSAIYAPAVPIDLIFKGIMTQWHIRSGQCVCS